jgi:hypothetical protein
MFNLTNGGRGSSVSLVTRLQNGFLCSENFPTGCGSHLARRLICSRVNRPGRVVDQWPPSGACAARVTAWRGQELLCVL